MTKQEFKKLGYNGQSEYLEYLANVLNQAKRFIHVVSEKESEKLKKNYDKYFELFCENDDN
jgi:hypothetical protein